MIYTVLPALYREVLTRLCDAVDGENYFSGSVAFRFAGAGYGAQNAVATEGVDCRLTASVIVCRTPMSTTEGVVDAISDFIPVWWEFHTSDLDGERVNDFSFSQLKRYL